MGKVIDINNAIHTAMQDLEAVKAFARKVTAKLMKEGYRAEALHTFTNEQDLPLCYVAKLKHSNGDKQFRPISFAGQQYQLKQPDWSQLYHTEGLKPLYNLTAITQNTQAVWIVEGEKDVDSLGKLDILATTSMGGANGVNSTHWQPLAGRKCVIWRDNDTAGQSYADDVIKQLEPLACDIWLVDIEQLNLPKKADVTDWIVANDSSDLDHDNYDDLKQMLMTLPMVQYTSNDTEQSTETSLDTSTETNMETATEASIDTGDAMTDEQVETLILELAELNKLAYERRRGGAADLIGIRASILDKLVKDAQKDLEADTSLQCMEVIQPHSEPVNGEQLLNDMVALVNRFIVCEPTTSHAVALWVAYTWCIDAFTIAPIACITAPEKRCGKTELLTLMGKMVKRPQEASFISPAALFRVVDEYQPTLLIDEVDAFMKQDEDMRGLINLGHARGKQVLRCVGDDNNVKGFNVFGAKVMSGINAEDLADTIRDRSIILELRRKLPHEKRDKQRHLDSEVTDSIKSRLARWADDHIDALKEARPALPQMINDRSQDNWEGLLAIASLVGDDWFKRATNAAVTLSGVVKDEPSINEQLLADIQIIFEKRKCERILTSVLLEELCSDDEAPWQTWNRGKELSSRQLANRLKGYDIRPTKWRMGNNPNNRGYVKADFQDAFRRYLSDPPFLSATTPQVNDSKGYSKILSATETKSVADRKTLEAFSGKGCGTVADRNPPVEENTLKSENVADKSGKKQPVDLPQNTTKNTPSPVAENVKNTTDEKTERVIYDGTNEPAKIKLPDEQRQGAFLI